MLFRSVEPPLNLRSLPARNSLSATLRVEARKLAVSIRAPWPISTPLGLIRNTRPFDCNEPRIWDSLRPVTRLSTAEAEFVWTNFAASLAPMEKPCQLMIVRSLRLVTVVVAPLCAIVAEPATVLPPVGPAYTGRASPNERAKATLTTALEANRSGRICPAKLARRASSSRIAVLADGAKRVDVARGDDRPCARDRAGSFGGAISLARFDIPFLLVLWRPAPDGLPLLDRGSSFLVLIRVFSERPIPTCVFPTRPHENRHLIFRQPDLRQSSEADPRE